MQIKIKDVNGQSNKVTVTRLSEGYCNGYSNSVSKTCLWSRIWHHGNITCETNKVCNCQTNLIRIRYLLNIKALPTHYQKHKSLKFILKSLSQNGICIHSYRTRSRNSKKDYAQSWQHKIRSFSSKITNIQAFNQFKRLIDNSTSIRKKHETAS